jgi:hypothetical protein
MATGRLCAVAVRMPAFPLCELRFFVGFVLKIRDPLPSPALIASISIHPRSSSWKGLKMREALYFIGYESANRAAGGSP